MSSLVGGHRSRGFWVVPSLVSEEAGVLVPAVAAGTGGGGAGPREPGRSSVTETTHRGRGTLVLESTWNNTNCNK